VRGLHARAELEIFGWRRILNRHIGGEPSIAFVRHSQTSSIQVADLPKDCRDAEAQAAGTPA
jgi:hypothetical protein